LDQTFGDLNRKYKKEMAERKRLHNLIQELKGNIRVFLRCRPPSTRELENSGGADTICVSFPDGGEVRVINEKGREKTWEFDEVFNLDTTQAQVYAEVSDLVTSVLDGYNVCIFAYGQTGSGYNHLPHSFHLSLYLTLSLSSLSLSLCVPLSVCPSLCVCLRKTFTMTGPPEHRGVNTRALDELFEKSQQRADEWVDTITVRSLLLLLSLSDTFLPLSLSLPLILCGGQVNVLEVYNEEIHDLLSGRRDEKYVLLLLSRPLSLTVPSSL
jgi:kinesin family member C2/C3